MKAVSAIPIEYGEKKYLELQISLEKLPKTKEGIAEAHARRMAFYDLHEGHPAVEKDAQERCDQQAELEIQAKCHEGRCSGIQAVLVVVVACMCGMAPPSSRGLAWVRACFCGCRRQQND